MILSGLLEMHCVFITHDETDDEGLSMLLETAGQAPSTG